MRLTILPSDKSVYVDGRCYSGIDMSWIPKINDTDVHAVQWYNDYGEIELITNDLNIEITELGVFEKAIPLWEEKHQEQLEIEENTRKENLRIEEENIRLQREYEGESINSNNDTIYYDIEELLKEI